MEKITVKVLHRGNGYPDYEVDQDFEIVEGDLFEAALEIIYRKLEAFSDEEIIDGTTAVAYVTDGHDNYKIYQIKTDGIFSEGDKVPDLDWVRDRVDTDTSVAVCWGEDGKAIRV